MFTLKMGEHSIRKNVPIVEIWNGNSFVGQICPTETGIKVLSKFFPVDMEGIISVDITIPELPAILVDITV